MTLAMDRPTAALGFEGIHNFRDFGGQRVPGGRVRLGALYRSAHFAQATDRDLEAFLGLGVHAIVDLRRPGEREVAVTRRHPDCKAIAVTYGDGSQIYEPPHLAFLHEPGCTPARVIARMAELYRDFPYHPGHLAVFRDAFLTLVDAPGPVVLHCHAGKDRTGVICALVLHALGVAPADIIKDFLRTNAESRIEERLPTVANQLRETGAGDIDLDLLRLVLRVDESYLYAAFDAIRQRSGSLDGYTTGDLAIGSDMLTRMKQRLVIAA